MTAAKNRPLISRRQLLVGGAGLAGAAGVGWWLLGDAAKRPHVRDMVVALRDVRADDAIDLALGWVAAGATREELLAAAFCAQALCGSDRGDPHAQLVPPSVAALCAAFPDAEIDGWIAALWAVEFASQWLLDAQPVAPARAGKTGIDAAMRAADPDQADAAVVALFADRPGAVVGALAPWTTCAMADPHTPILLGQTAAGLAFLPGDLHLPMLRSAARRLARRAAPTGREWEADRELAAAARKGPEAPDGVLDLVGLMAAGEEEGALRELSRFGTGPSWRTPLRAGVLCGAGIIPVAPSSSGMGVHATTLADALCSLGTHATPEGRVLLGRRSVRWFTQLLTDHDGALWHPEEELAAPDNLGELPADADPINRARAWFREGGQTETYARWLARRALAGAEDAHDFKYAAALLATTPLIPEVGRTAALSYTATVALARGERGGSDHRDLAEKVRHALRQSGRPSS